MSPTTNQPPVWQKNLFLVAAGVISLFITWNIIQRANQNRQLQQQAIQIQAEIDLLQQQKKNQTLDNTFLESDYYLDFAVRNQQGYLLPEEKLLIIDEERITELETEYSPPATTVAIEEVETTNLQQWWDFVFNSGNAVADNQ